MRVDSSVNNNDDQGLSPLPQRSESHDMGVIDSSLPPTTSHNDNNAPVSAPIISAPVAGAPGTPPKVELLTAIIPGQAEPLSFTEGAMQADDECGFRELRVMRAEVVSVLERAAYNAAAQEALSQEIYAAFTAKTLKPYQGWEGLEEAYQSANKAFSEAYLNIKRAIINSRQINVSPSSITEENIHEYVDQGNKGVILNRQQACVAAENKLMAFCKKSEVVLHYVQAYHFNEKQKGLPLGVDSACVYAKEKNVSVYFWTKNGSQLKIYKEYVSTDPNAHKAHFLMKDSSTDYSPLMLANNKNTPAHQKDEWAKKISENKVLIKEEMSRFLIEALQASKTGNGEQPTQRETFFWLLDTLVLPSNEHFLKQTSMMNKKLREKKNELDQKILESYKTHLMLESIDGGPAAQGDVFDGVERFYVSTGANLSKLKSPSMPKQRYCELIKHINLLFQRDLLLCLVSKDNFETLILSGKYGHRFTRKDACFYSLREPYSGEVILLRRDRDHIFSAESTLFCSGETKFRANDRYNRENSKLGIYSGSQPGSRKHVAETLKSDWIRSANKPMLQHKQRSLGKGIFEELAFIWREGNALSAGLGKVGRLFGETSEIINLLHMLIRLEVILNASDMTFKQTLIQLKDDEQTFNWFTKNNNTKKEVLKFLESIPSLKHTDYDAAKLTLNDIRDYCLNQGKNLCGEQEVCLNYLNLYVQNPDQWLCEAGKNLYYEIKKNHLSSEAPEWFEMQEFSVEEILPIVEEVLSNPSRSEPFQEPIFTKAINFIKNPNRQLDREILEFCAKGRGFELREFSIIDISKQTNHPDLPKIGRLRVEPSSRNIPANGRVWNVVCDKGVYKKLSLEDNHFTVKYSLRLDPPKGVLLKNEIYIEAEEDHLLKYTVIDGENRRVMSTLAPEELPFLVHKAEQPLDLNKIEKELPAILKITTARGHTRKTFIEDFFSEVAQEMKYFLDQNLSLPVGADKDPNFDYNAHVKKQLSILKGYFAQILIKENQEIKEITADYEALLAQQGSLNLINRLQETRADKFAKMPSSVRSYLKNKLLQDLARKFLGYVQLPTAEDLEGLGYALCDFEFNIDEVRDGKGSLFYILLTMDTSDHFLKEFLKRSPDPFSKTTINGESPMEYLSRKAIENRGKGKEDSIEKFVFCAFHVIESLSLMLVAERHLVKDLLDLREADEKTSDFLVDDVKGYLQDNKADLEKKRGFELFDKIPNRSKSIVKLLNVFFEHLKSKDYKNALSALKQIYEEIERGSFGRFGSRLMTMMDDYIEFLTEILKKPTMAIAMTAYDALRRAKLAEETVVAQSSAHGKEVDQKMLARDKKHTSEIAKLTDAFGELKFDNVELRQENRAHVARSEAQDKKIRARDQKIETQDMKLETQAGALHELKSTLNDLVATVSALKANQANSYQGGDNRPQQSPHGPGFFPPSLPEHRLGLMVSGVAVQKGEIYIEKQGDLLKYTMINAENRFLIGTLSAHDVPLLAGKITENLNLEEIKPLLPQMLRIISARGPAWTGSTGHNP
jgi:hypothetical protein